MRVINIRMGGGGWTSGRHGDLFLLDRQWWVVLPDQRSLALLLYSKRSSEVFPRLALFCHESSSAT